MEVEDNCVMKQSPLISSKGNTFEIIGYGTGTIVYRVISEKFPKMAVKIVKKGSRKSLQWSRRLCKEADILKDIHHPNIVSYMGYLILPEEHLLMIEELDQSLGDFLETLKDTSHGPMLPNDVCHVLIGVCQALDYLHTVKNIIHGDIKSHNILIKGQLNEVKLCDFGLSVRLGADGFGDVEQYVGTTCWAPPEAQGAGPLTAKADIFSLGMNAELPKTLKKQHNLFIDVFHWCTKSNYRARPSAKNLLEVLGSAMFSDGTFH